MTALTELVGAYPGTLLLAAFVAFASAYVVYQRFLHPLAGYPGPFLASLTDLWQVFQYMGLKQPYHLTELHEKYGTFVRYGPDKISVTEEEAVAVIYQKGGRAFVKTEFYDAYGAAVPNIFGMRDEDAHSMRRRSMSHSFSLTYIKHLEQYLDLNLGLLTNKIQHYCDHNEAFDLKRSIHFYVIDVLGELAFGQSFGIQRADDDSLAPPVVQHTLLAAVTGAWPAMTARLKRWLPYLPYAPLQNLIKGRTRVVHMARESVARRRQEIDRLEKAGVKEDGFGRKDMLTDLILARNPDTGLKLSQSELETEAFGMIVAGTHTTSATTTLLFYHLLHNPAVLQQCVDELDAMLPGREPEQTSYPISLLEASLPFTRNCIKENFRLTPVFTMPLARHVTQLEGITIAGRYLPQGTSIAICNHAMHHNPAIFGDAHNVYDPHRWDDPATNSKSRLLMHFGLGGRQCLGKTLATTNVTKLTATLLKEFDFELADDEERKAATRGAYRGVLPDLISVSVSDLAGSLMVRARRREKEGAQAQ